MAYWNNNVSSVRGLQTIRPHSDLESQRQIQNHKESNKPTLSDERCFCIRDCASSKMLLIACTVSLFRL